MKKIITGFLAGGLIASLVTLNIPRTVTNRDINAESINAVLWVQTSAEYRALCYQAYNTALERVRNAERGDKPLAIVLDCDETVLDNTPPDAAMAFMEDTSGVFSKWVKAGEAGAMPGAADFLNAVDALGVNIFYVTNRRENTRADTMRNMKALNFPQVDDVHTVFRTDEGSKDPRFMVIAESYDVVVYLGDSAQDFPTDSYGKGLAERNAKADSARELFGRKYIVLPNPIYGQWLDVFTGKTPEDTLKAKTKSMRLWKP